MENARKFTEVTIDLHEFMNLAAKTAAELTEDMNLSEVESYKFMVSTSTYASRLTNNLFYGRRRK